jgi:hypothetical protein
MTNDTPTDVTNRHFGGFIPLLLFGTALLVLLVFQAIQLNRERGNLKATIASQEQPIQESQRLRTQLDGVAGDTARLAQDGNPNAAAIIEELAKRGIRINLQGADQAAEGEAAD